MSYLGSCRELPFQSKYSLSSPADHDSLPAYDSVHVHMCEGEWE